jgi:hypothetical protein
MTFSAVFLFDKKFALSSVLLGLGCSGPIISYVLKYLLFCPAQSIRYAAVGGVLAISARRGWFVQ